MRIFSNPELISAIDEYALFAREMILDDYNNKDLFDIVQENGINLFGIYDDKYESICIWNPDINKPEIYLNMKSSKEERLFALACELGCLFINYEWLPNKKIKNTKDKKSKNVLSVNFKNKDSLLSVNDEIVRQFASTFLMPKDKIDEVINNYHNKEDLDYMITSVEKHFGVTYQVATNRLIALGKICAK